jgi:hypothetical protein
MPLQTFSTLAYNTTNHLHASESLIALGPPSSRVQAPLRNPALPTSQQILADAWNEYIYRSLGADWWEEKAILRDSRLDVANGAPPNFPLGS